LKDISKQTLPRLTAEGKQAQYRLVSSRDWFRLIEAILPRQAFTSPKT
jgi:hypothetical protein